MENAANRCGYSRVDAHDDLVPAADEDERTRPTSMPDPLNPNRLPWPGYDADPADRDSVGSIPELPDAHPHRPTVEAGEESSHERAVMVLLDGWEWNVAKPIAPTFDNLISDGVIPPLVVVMPESLGHKVRNVEMPCHEPFVEFLGAELLQWARERWGVTADPARTIVAGQSYGGLASAFAGLRRPDVFGNVVSQSGSFWWKADTEFDIEAEWLVRRFAVEPRVAVRFRLEIGLLEGGGMLASNRHLRDVLDAKGYDVTYAEYNHDHWWPSWRATLPDALQAITRGWASVE